MIGKLSIVGTPIGNLEDITLRALRTLRECEVIICEDTRVTKKVLFFYEIKPVSLWSYDEHSHNSITPKIIEALSAGKHLALVSDAGMPTISDPGSYLVATIRKELPSCTIEVVGGPTAITNAIAWSGIDTSAGFCFIGFIPHKKGRETLFHKIVAMLQANDPAGPVIAYESSHRIQKTIQWFNDNAPNITITVCREMTKLHEDIVVGKPSEILEYLDQPHKSKGEFVVLFSKTKDRMAPQDNT